MRASTFYHTTDVAQLRAATFLVPGEEILLAFKRGDDSEELVFTTESTLNVYKTRPVTTIERGAFSAIARLAFRDAACTKVEEEAHAGDQQQQNKFAFVEFVVGPEDEEQNYTIAVETSEGSQKFAKVVFNAISILQRTVNLRDERMQSVQVVKNLLAEARGERPRAVATASTWLWP